MKNTAKFSTHFFEISAVFPAFDLNRAKVLMRKMNKVKDLGKFSKTLQIKRKKEKGYFQADKNQF